jgi:YegS/Rv2252/BmrU family lipid kinase
MVALSKAILFYNTKSGHSRAEKHLQIIENHFAQSKIQLQIYEVPLPQHEIDAIINSAIKDGVEMVIAAGGDGTVSFVSQSLIGSEIPLGIIPLGTGNMLAKELKIPLRLEKALETLTSDDKFFIQMDTFKLDEHYHILNVSVGVSPEVMKETRSEEKKRYGFFAYIAHTIAQIMGLKLHRFILEYDDKKTIQLASEIVITNARAFGSESFQLSDNIAIDDGILDILVIRAKNIFDILGLAVSIFAKKQKSNPAIKILQFREYCRIDSLSKFVSQADGDVIGQTPLEIRVVPKSLRIITARPDIYQ